MASEMKMSGMKPSMVKTGEAACQAQIEDPDETIKTAPMSPEAAGAAVDETPEPVTTRARPGTRFVGEQELDMARSPETVGEGGAAP